MSACGAAGDQLRFVLSAAPLALRSDFAIAGNLLVVVRAAHRRICRVATASGASLTRELAAEQRIERLRVPGEMRAAREIQMGMLPDPRNIAGLPRTLDFFALLEPAQDVGGDLYDAFMLDAHRLCFMIGDVSGKGVPASLFMALAKTLSKSLARRESDPLDRIVRAVNEEISRENPAAMFVTAIIGIIDARIGRSGAVQCRPQRADFVAPKQAPRDTRRRRRTAALRR